MKTFLGNIFFFIFVFFYAKFGFYFFPKELTFFLEIFYSEFRSIRESFIKRIFFYFYLYGVYSIIYDIIAYILHFFF